MRCLPGPVLDKNFALMGPETLFSTGTGGWRKAPGPGAFPDSSSILDEFQSAILRAWYNTTSTYTLLLFPLLRRRLCRGIALGQNRVRMVA